MSLPKFFKNKNIVITGHTGFKGSWLSLILSMFGAKVTGFSKNPEGWDSIYSLLKIENFIQKSVIGDLSNLDLLTKTMEDANPDIIFHLAAQPFVLRSYQNPIETWQSNVMGTLNMFESTKNLNNLQAIINVTTDKCYKNKEWDYPYRENDELGGHDPYSASKAAVEVLSSSYKNSFLKKRGIQMATVRGGNVIGGGDFGENRLLPSIIHSLKFDSQFIIRKPTSIRPWQHVIDILNGYIMVSKKIYETDGFDESYNIAPDNIKNLTVIEIVDIIKAKIPALNFMIKIDQNDPHEANLLKLDNSFTKSRIGWKPLMTNFEAIDLTLEWYQEYLFNKDNMLDITNKQIENFFILDN